MRFSKVLTAAAALLAVVGAQAQVTGSLGGGTGTFLSLSSSGLAGGAVATLTGGTVYGADRPFADIPAGAVYGGEFLAAGPTSGQNATLAFSGAGVEYISFLWGSPDTYNKLTVTTTGGVQTVFTTSNLSFAVSDGNQSFSQYVQFTADAGSKITALSFYNSPVVDAFETANFSVSAVPEPQTYALLLAGLGAIAFAARRRRD